MTGEWILVENGAYGLFDIYQCSVCRNIKASNDINKVVECPYCGSKMKGGTE